MNHLELLIPFALPPTEWHSDLRPALIGLQLFHLGKLLTRSHIACRQNYDPFARSLPHEAWLRQTMNPVCHAQRVQYPVLPMADGRWFVMQPVHLHIARDHLVLTNTRQLTLTESEAQALFNIAHTICAEHGHNLLYGSAHYWYLHAEAWQDLQTSTPDAACGRNIDLWQPQGSSARAWRILQNDIQMAWHIAEVNQLRSTSDQDAINGLWLWDGNAVTNTAQTIVVENAKELLALPDDKSLLYCEQLLLAALQSDWSAWIEQFQRLETDWFTPLYAALASRRLASLTLTLSNSTTLRSYRISQLACYQFWQRPSIAALFL